MNLKFVDLFCGAGGFHIGLRDEAECVFACDSDKNVRETYRLNFPQVKLGRDIRNLSPDKIPDHDILCAGFPCQAFSIAGKKKGFKDKHNGFQFFEILRIAKEKKPKFLLLENVKGLRFNARGRNFNIVISSLLDIGYSLAYIIMDAQNYGLPQHRERIFILGSRDKKIRPDLDGRIYHHETTSPVCPMNDFRHYVDLEAQKPLKYYIKPKDSCYKPLINAAKGVDYFYSYRMNHVRVSKRGLCPTLAKIMGTGGHNVPFVVTTGGIRRLTPRECFNLQGFPLTYKFPDMRDCLLYQQAGNAVSPVMVAWAWKYLKILIR